MKKILCSLLLVGFAYSQTTGNDFLEKFPFGLDRTEMTRMELDHHEYYIAMIHGIIYGSSGLLMDMRDRKFISQEIYELWVVRFRTCKMSENQIIRIIKKWCDNNPNKTHLTLMDITFRAIFELPIDDDCL